MMQLSSAIVDFLKFYDGSVDTQVWTLLTKRSCKVSVSQVIVKTRVYLFVVFSRFPRQFLSIPQDWRKRIFFLKMYINIDMCIYNDIFYKCTGFNSIFYNCSIFEFPHLFVTQQWRLRGDISVFFSLASLYSIVAILSFCLFKIKWNLYFRLICFHINRLQGHISHGKFYQNFIQSMFSWKHINTM